MLLYVVEERERRRDDQVDYVMEQWEREREDQRYDVMEQRDDQRYDVMQQWERERDDQNDYVMGVKHWSWTVRWEGEWEGFRHRNSPWLLIDFLWSPLERDLHMQYRASACTLQAEFDRTAEE